MAEYRVMEDDDDANKDPKSSSGSTHQHVLQYSPVSSSSFASRDVNYSCGACGYELNLSSCNRNTSSIGVEYGKKIKRGIISFFTVDETRFAQKNKLRCLPYFTSKHSWGLFQRHTKLLCRNCGNYIGIAYKETAAASNALNKLVKSNTLTWDGISGCRAYDIKIRALRPSSLARSLGRFIDIE